MCVNNLLETNRAKLSIIQTSQRSTRTKLDNTIQREKDKDKQAKQELSKINIGGQSCCFFINDDKTLNIYILYKFTKKYF